MIEVRNLSIQVGNKLILDDISAQIERGQITAILGPNGAGKSSLLKCLTGACKYDSGTLSLDGQPLESYSLNELSKKRAVLSQSNPISFPFTALEIVMMGRNPYAQTSSAKEDFQIAQEALAYVDALSLQDQRFPTLSGGEQQRIQFARVLAQLWEQDNAYLFLDEPTSALDLKHQYQLLEIVSQLATERNFAICIIMHDLKLAMHYADQIILLKQGKLFASGTTDNVLTPENIEAVFEISASLVLGDHMQRKQPYLAKSA
jgi:iron complex transport system ATP-binding protein